MPTALNTSIIGIWGDAGAIDTKVHFALQLEGIPSFEVMGPFNGKGRRNILPESYLYDRLGVEVRKEPTMAMLFPDTGKAVSIYRRNGLYFVRGRVLSLMEQDEPYTVHESSFSECNEVAELKFYSIIDDYTT